MTAPHKESQAEVSVMSLMLSRIEEIASNTTVMSSKIGEAITDIRKEVHDIEVQVTTVATKLDSVIRTLGVGEDSMASVIVNLQTRVDALENEVHVTRDQANRVRMAWANSFLFPIFIAAICSLVGWILMQKTR